ncbi:rRNA maturation RNase YbeY [Aliikangiella sp. G2MR2-5]|uniref:rRNA maturation RNase YbeY n=1 Tax=Aliikangiella sp. G2MR2-5 TaxID=2788943 RepID=UPI0018AA1A0F|nr:rRNA maturation RNase YbeY [Aliikangiella sp. G2MR2-5]
MQLFVEIQNPENFTDIPESAKINEWIGCALQHADYSSDEAELTVRVVGEAESQQLNSQYRGKNKPTNVLSFPFEAPFEIETCLLGDLVICQPILVAEAKEQGKAEQSHWAHLIVHGTLHLLGYDHIDDEEAEAMECLETTILQSLKFEDPYQE